MRGADVITNITSNLIRQKTDAMLFPRLGKAGILWAPGKSGSNWPTLTLSSGWPIPVMTSFTKPIPPSLKQHPQNPYSRRIFFFLGLIWLMPWTLFPSCIMTQKGSIFASFWFIVGFSEFQLGFTLLSLVCCWFDSFFSLFLPNQLHGYFWGGRVSSSSPKPLMSHDDPFIDDPFFLFY